MDFKESTKGNSQYNLGIMEVLESKDITEWYWSVGNIRWIRLQNLFMFRDLKYTKSAFYEIDNSIIVNIDDLWK